MEKDHRSEQNQQSGGAGAFNFSRLFRKYRDLRGERGRLKQAYESLPFGRVSRSERKQLNKELAQIHGQERRVVLKFLAGMGATGLGLTALGWGVKSLFDSGAEDLADEQISARSDLYRPIDIPEDVGIKNFSAIEKPSFSGQSEFERMLEFSDYWKNVCFDAMEFFRTADPRMAEVISYMRENAFYSIPQGPQVTQMIFSVGADAAMDPLDNPRSFEIVFMPEEYASYYPGPILTEEGGKTVRVMANFKTKEWLGIMLGHELKHVIDQLVHGEDSRNEQQYLAGEVQAHLFEMNLLKHWDVKTYNFLIDRGRPLFKKGMSEGNIGEFLNFVYKLYPVSEPAVSFHEAALGKASCMMAVAFEDALISGKNQRDLALLYKQLRDTFH